jgi:hypothetical protein
MYMYRPTLIDHLQRVFCVARLSAAEWATSSVAMQQRCCLLCGERSDDKNAVCIILSLLPLLVADVPENCSATVTVFKEKAM